MDPKQTVPQGGQEGQGAGPAGNAGFNFSADGSRASNKLSTGANVSRTMDSLNSEQGATYGGMSFSKHNFDKIEPGTGDIILGASDSNKPKRGLFGLGRKSSAKPSGWDMNAAQAEEAAKTGTAPTEQAFTTNRSSVAIVPSEYQNPAPVKKPINKKLLIGLVAIVLVIGVGAAVATVVVPNLSKGNKSNGGGSTYKESNLTLQESFNRYANWMASGSDSTDGASIIDISATEGYRKAVSEGHEAVVSFLTTASQYRQDFEYKFNKSEYASDEALKKTVEEEGDLLSTAIAYYGLGDTTLDAALKDTIDSGVLDASFYDALAKSGGIGAQIADYLKSRDEQLEKIANALIDANCVKDDEVDQECFRTTVFKTDESADSYYRAASANVNANELMSTANNDLLSNIRTINSGINTSISKAEEAAE